MDRSRFAWRCPSVQAHGLVEVSSTSVSKGPPSSGTSDVADSVEDAATPTALQEARAGSPRLGAGGRPGRGGEELQEPFRGS